MPLWEELSDTMKAFWITAAAAGVVIAPMYFLFGRHRLLPMQRLRKGAWSGREVWLAFIVFILTPQLALSLLEPLNFFEAIFDEPPSFMRKVLWASPLTFLLHLAILFWLFFRMSGTRPSHFGLTLARWPQNCLVGYFGFLILTPVVRGLYWLIQVIFLLVFNASPESHLLEMLGKEPLMVPEWVLLFFEASVAASLVEELLFRGILQGWLQRASVLGHAIVILATVGFGLFAFIRSLHPLPDESVSDPNPGPLIFAIILALGYGSALYYNPLPEKKNNHLLAIFGSAVAFAVSHSAWPSPIPLFVLGLGLGYLAYRTQNLVAGILVHGLFNMVSVLELWFSRVSF